MNRIPSTGSRIEHDSNVSADKHSSLYSSIVIGEGSLLRLGPRLSFVSRGCRINVLRSAVSEKSSYIALVGCRPYDRGWTR